MFSKVAVVALALPFFVQSATAATCTRSYTVQAGDICDSISASQHVSTYQLASVNAGVFNSDCTNLQPGTSICLGYEGQDCDTTYVVKAQDTCAIINAAYNINSTLLYGNNPQINSDCSNIYVGEVLCVAGTIASPPVGSAPVDTAIPSTATAAVSATPTPSSTPTSSSTPSSTPASSASAATSTSDDSGDDDDLPYCDEL
ncbi:hypothetical protein D9757_003014 [Collybiopsis confluens]|uniref:LysM domain-containing protein n=1 Tax=Collybiopsis confluens TaxID=2823264 RepID=A0A8H5HX67_9AGAR|nr:hypothetical protein D9757_003014 [Collybiopsis confluens]